jgi:hypothetical protein
MNLEYYNKDLIDPPLPNDDANAYDLMFRRGISYYSIDSFALAISDFTNTIDTKIYLSESYFYRGLSRLALGDSSNGCEDLHQAKNANYTLASDSINQKCRF